jgi:hypothetical protein
VFFSQNFNPTSDMTVGMEASLPLLPSKLVYLILPGKSCMNNFPTAFYSR